MLSTGIEALTSVGSANQSWPPVNRAVGTFSSVKLYEGGVGCVGVGRIVRVCEMGGYSECVGGEPLRTTPRRKQTIGESI